ncbi:ADOP family duplicated permease [Gemmatimonadota bacterium]
MGWFWGFCERFNAIFRRRSVERKLDEDIQLYLENSTERNIEQGMNPAEARRIAYRNFGGVERNKERTRDEQGVRLLLDLSQDIRYGVRTFLKNPGFTVIVLLTLALGIGANAAIFSVVDDVLLHPLDVPEPERVVQILDTFPESAPVAGNYLTSIPNFVDYKAQNEVFEQVATIQATIRQIYLEFFLEGTDRPAKITANYFDSDLLALLGVKPFLGRGFLPEEDVWDAPPAVLLTYGFWQRHFGGDPNIVGQTMSCLSEESGFNIVGVLPPDFHIPAYLHTKPQFSTRKGIVFGTLPDMFISMSFLNQYRHDDQSYRHIAALARLKPGVTLEQAQANMDGISARIAAEGPPIYAEYRAVITPLPQIIRRAYGPGLYFLVFAAGFVLLLVCINIANLLLSRVIGRERELAVRAALGAGRGRLFRQLLTESMILGLMGGAIGLLPAYGGSVILQSLMPSYIYRLNEVSVDIRVLLFVVVISVITAILFGLLSATRVLWLDLPRPLKESSHGSVAKRLRILHVLVATQVALALILLTGAGLVLSGYMYLVGIDPGYDIENILIVEFEKLPYQLTKYQGLAENHLFAGIIERLETVPGVLSVAGVDYPPLSRNMISSFTVADGPLSATQARETLVPVNVTPGYLETMNLQLLAGRALNEDDNEQRMIFNDSFRTLYQQYQSASREEQLSMRREHAIPVIINDTMARRYWPGQNPLGKGFYTGRIDPDNPPLLLRTIVGIVEDFKLKKMDEKPTLHCFSPAGSFLPSLVLRTRSDPLAMTEVLTEEIEAMDKTELSVTGFWTLKERYLRATSDSRYQMVMMVIFSAIATILAAIGLLGLMAYLVMRRTHEIGVRLSLGAQPKEIFRLVLRQGMLLTAIGIAIGLIASFTLTRYISSLLFEVDPIDPVILGSASVFLGIVALLASYIPSHRASRVDPVKALRSE